MALQVRVKSKFPSRVVGSGGVSVTKSGGVYTIAGDLTSYPNLDTINDLTMAANQGIYFTDADTAAAFDLTAAARALLDDASASDMRTTLGLIIGTDVQAFDADLSAIAALAKDDGNIIVGNGTAWVAESGATARTSLGLAIGTDVQAYDADLTTIGGLAKTDGNFIVADGTTWTVESGATARTSLGLAIGSDVQAYTASLSELAALARTSGNIIVGNGTSWTAQSASTYIGSLTATLTNKTYDTAGAGNSFSINGVAANANTGTGAVVRATSATLVTPVLGAATATSLNTYVPNSAMAQPYSEGTWTPSVTASGTPGTPSYTTQVGTYKKIGKLVQVSFSIIVSGWTGTPAGNVTITGLPFTATVTANDFGGASLNAYSVAGLAASNYGIVGFVAPSTTVISLQSYGNNGVTLVTAAHTGTAPNFYGFAIYHTDS